MAKKSGRKNKGSKATKALKAPKMSKVSRSKVAKTQSQIQSLSSVGASAKNAWSRMVSSPLSVWRPVAADIGFLFALGFIGGAIAKKVEAVLISVGAATAQASQTDFVVPAAQQGLLWSALGLQALYFAVMYILFCTFAAVGWHWAAAKNDFPSYLKKFFHTHALLLVPFIMLDVIWFYKDFLVLQGESAVVWSAVYYVGLILLIAFSLISSARLHNEHGTSSLKTALSHMTALTALAPLGVVALGVVFIDVLIRIVMPMSYAFAIILGIGLLFPYLAWMRLFLVEVFG